MAHVFLISLAPVFIILIYVYLRDKYEKEPILLLAISLLLGAMTTIPIVITERFLLGINPFSQHMPRITYISFLVAGFSEEYFKFVAVVALIWRNKNFNQRYDGIMYSVFVGLGFAGVENILYVNEFGTNVAFMRAVSAVPAHAIFGIVMGYYLGMAKFAATNSQVYVLKALAIPVLLHGLYDFLVLSDIPILLLLMLPYLAYLYGSGVRKMKELNMMKSPYYDDNQQLL